METELSEKEFRALLAVVGLNIDVAEIEPPGKGGISFGRGLWLVTIKRPGRDTPERILFAQSEQDGWDKLKKLFEQGGMTIYADN